MNEIIKKPITKQDLKRKASEIFGNMIKAVVDIKKEIIAINSELHSDQEAKLLSSGSKQSNLWGINIYPDLPKDEWIEFDSMINLRPSDNNLSRDIEDKKIRKQIQDIINKLIK